MKRVKKNHIIITALAIMIAAAGYINYAGDLDYIIKVNGSQTDTKEQLLQAVSESAGNSMDITVRRDGQEIEEQIIPVKNSL